MPATSQDEGLDCGGWWSTFVCWVATRGSGVLSSPAQSLSHWMEKCCKGVHGEGAEMGSLLLINGLVLTALSALCLCAGAAQHS